ncbi:thioredoxin H-type 2-like isoform X2 [Panicum virgatum]|uniref:thioredoxin H-type 2-like isoform X2 n=1 Tax=Panicum virgatum TaxID=38727 RepID=UPI0019D55CA0|nr:thioredoxin H-type 2-like isoform X2 [Panicum virgatum]
MHRNPGLLSRKAKDGSTIVDDEDHREVRRRWAGAQGIMSNAENGNKLLVLEFTAPWSEPCKYMSKVLDGNPPGRGLAYELQDYADFCSLDITKFRQFAQRMTVEALPTFLLLKQGYTVLGRVVGVDKEELRSSIKQEQRQRQIGRPGNGEARRRYR